ncbi:MAG TPA: isoaspartyl peptidase/L-asparaginase [Terriglobales bacterium]|nr:isoaspartyl peptidase/L-asparaginase [Terriglobales bacterium]
MDHTPAIIVHGGAGSIKDDSLGERLEGCRAAAIAGWEKLRTGGRAVDAVETAVEWLENHPLFNAGTGSTLNSRGQVEMDAAIMEGESLRAGAVAAVERIKNPIKLARRVMEDGRHILLVGKGALAFARSVGIPPCKAESLIVAAERERWQAKHGTVGAVALDENGRIAVATSTGGIFNKLPGRVGDSPLLGCGTYADDAGGVSCTGHGEGVMRVLLAKTALDYLHRGLDPWDAAREAVAWLSAKTGSTGGLILIARGGAIGYARNTAHMPICWIRDDAGLNVDH